MAARFQLLPPTSAPATTDLAPGPGTSLTGPSAAPPAAWTPSPLAELPTPRTLVVPGAANPLREYSDYAGLLSMGYVLFAKHVQGYGVNGIVSRPAVDGLWARALVDLAAKEGGRPGGTDSLVMDILSVSFRSSNIWTLLTCITGPGFGIDGEALGE